MNKILLLPILAISLYATDCTCERGTTFWQIDASTTVRTSPSEKYPHSKYTQEDINAILEKKNTREVCYKKDGNRFLSNFRTISTKFNSTEHYNHDETRNITAWWLSTVNTTVETLYQCCNEEDENYNIDVSVWSRSSLPSLNSCQEHLGVSLVEQCSLIGGTVLAEKKEDCCIISSCFVPASPACPTGQIPLLGGVCGCIDGTIPIDVQQDGEKYLACLPISCPDSDNMHYENGFEMCICNDGYYLGKESICWHNEDNNTSPSPDPDPFKYNSLYRFKYIIKQY